MTRENTKRVVDARPIVERKRAAAALRAKAGLVEAWTSELSGIPVPFHATQAGGLN
jgi:hypothetical protein